MQLEIKCAMHIFMGFLKRRNRFVFYGLDGTRWVLGASFVSEEGDKAKPIFIIVQCS